jgi:ATP-dependent protease HslVU (ClpYQ) ATPase subunit
MTHIKEILDRLIEVRNKTREEHTSSALDLLINDIEDEILEIESLIKEASEMGFDELEEIFLKEMLDHAFRTGEIGYA